MIQLFAVSVLWALSFGLTAQVGGLGAPFVTAVRTLLAALVFLPFLRLRDLPAGRALRLAAIGALQFGLMYGFYVASFRWLRASEVALFTSFTPLFVTLAGDLLEGRVRARVWLAVAVAVLGTGICVGSDLGRTGLARGFFLVQGANLCFALGQVLYRREAPRSGRTDRELMGLLYLGAAAVTLTLAAPWIPWKQAMALTLRQGVILVYLGVIASGLGFFLFNAGARQTDLGTLAIFNNLKIPLAILAAGLVFREAVDWPRLALGGMIIAAALTLNGRSGGRP